jgi:hypothetical protein
MASDIGIDEVCISNSIFKNLQQILNPTIQRRHDLGCQIQRKWGYIQLGLVALVFGGLQVWWISSVFWRRDLARPQNGGEFRKTLERIWAKGQRTR